MWTRDTRAEHDRTTCATPSDLTDAEMACTDVPAARDDRAASRVADA
jgi:hypothetical protein